jgi:hypothetical protein
MRLGNEIETTNEGLESYMEVEICPTEIGDLLKH